ncbi:MAG: hypothetical protein ABSB33_01545, partial [Tepidisphaeraceae bacterium]
MPVTFSRWSLLIAGVAGAVFCGGCKPQSPPPVPRAIDFRKPLPEGMVALRKIDPSEYPNFAEQPIDPVRLRAAI